MLDPGTMMLIGGGMSLAGGLFGANAQAKAARDAAKAARFTPWDVSTGVGSATFGPNRQISTSLAPEYEAMRQGLFGQLGASPMDMAGTQFGRYMSFLDPQQQRERSTLENRLFAQGMLGSTGGAQRAQALSQAHQGAITDAASRSMSEGLNYQTQLLNTLFGIEQLPMNLANMGMTAGGRSSAAGASQAPYIMGQAAPASAFGNFLGSAGQGMMMSGMLNPGMPQGTAAAPSPMFMMQDPYANAMLSGGPSSYYNLSGGV